MKPQIAFTVLALFCLNTMPLLADEKQSEFKGCISKHRSISVRIEQAQAENYPDKKSQAGKKSSQPKIIYTDAILEKQHTDKVKKAQKDVSQRKADLITTKAYQKELEVELSELDIN